MAKYAIGLDFGTNSVRTVIVNTANGEVIYTTSQRTAAAKNEIRLNLSIKKLSTPNRRTNELDQQLVNHSRYYYARIVQSDGGTAWSSPIWVDFEFPRD